MFRIFRIVGDSMSPEIANGDYVVLATSPRFLRRLQPGQVIVFHHPAWGTLIKRIQRRDPSLGYYVVGAHPESLDSRKLGYISREQVIGRMIAHIRRPRRAG